MESDQRIIDIRWKYASISLDLRLFNRKTIKTLKTQKLHLIRKLRRFV